jgi:pimeloyl-ACP methyl ester carboxylesterase
LGTLILVPGLLCDRAVYEAQIAHLSAHAEVRLAEHGELDSLPAMAQRILAAAPSRFAIAGHSMGGRVAMEVMRLAPARVAALALLDTAYLPLGSGEAGARERQARLELLALAEHSGMTAMARVWVQGMVHRARLNDAALIEPIVAMLTRRTPAIFAAQTRALLARPDATEVLRAVSCPTLILCGEDDSNAPPERHREMHALIAGSKLVQLAACGHMCTMERPAEVNAALGDWLAN